MKTTVPLPIFECTVLPEWIDYNGHMNVAFYNLAFDKSVDEFFDLIGIGVDYVEQTNNSAFILESHVHYMQEVVEGDPLRFTLRLLDVDAKRAHYYLEMFHASENYLAATSEQILIHLDLGTRRTSEFPQDALDKLYEMAEFHKQAEVPERVGHVIGIRRKSA
ncbi:MAG TPA: thioesterase [Sneathiellales bacterium]|nr:thioesterase [Sneathiellales bacterium]